MSASPGGTFANDQDSALHGNFVAVLRLPVDERESFGVRQRGNSDRVSRHVAHCSCHLRLVVSLIVRDRMDISSTAHHRHEEFQGIWLTHASLRLPRMIETSCSLFVLFTRVGSVKW